MSRAMENSDAVVVGGGIAGLAAAAYIGRAGKSVVLYEKSSALGGRAATHEIGQCLFNLGPHALYRQGPASEVLRELGVKFNGGVPSPSGGFAIRGGRKHALPGGLVSLLTTGLFGVAAKLEVARLLAGFARIDAQPLQRLTVREWLDTAVRHPEVRELIGALMRLASYTDAPETMSAGAAVAGAGGDEPGARLAAPPPAPPIPSAPWLPSPIDDRRGGALPAYEIPGADRAAPPKGATSCSRASRSPSCSRSRR